MNKKELAKLVLSPEELVCIDYGLPQSWINTFESLMGYEPIMYVWSYYDPKGDVNFGGRPVNLAEKYLDKILKDISVEKGYNTHDGIKRYIEDKEKSESILQAENIAKDAVIHDRQINFEEIYLPMLRKKFIVTLLKSGNYIIHSINPNEKIEIDIKQNLLMNHHTGSKCENGIGWIVENLLNDK